LIVLLKQLFGQIKKSNAVVEKRLGNPIHLNSFLGNLPKAGCDPLNKLIDQMPDENTVSVDI
jgi:hypothetical protein